MRGKKLSHYRHAGAKGVRNISKSFLTSALYGKSGHRHAPASIYPQGKYPPVPIAEEAGRASEDNNKTDH
jgi:hypothetical protein